MQGAMKPSRAEKTFLQRRTRRAVERKAVQGTFGTEGKEKREKSKKKRFRGGISKPPLVKKPFERPWRGSERQVRNRQKKERRKIWPVGAVAWQPQEMKIRRNLPHHISEQRPFHDQNAVVLGDEDEEPRAHSRKSARAMTSAAKPPQS